jgi:hypothetical protein
MISSLSRTPLREPVRQPAATTRPTGSKSFNSIISGAGRKQIVQAKSTAAASAVTANSTAPVSQNSVAAAMFSNTVQAASVTAATVSKAAEPAVQTADSDAQQNAIAQLTKALQAAGIDTSKLNISAHDDIATFPGTSGWTNRQITVSTGAHTENYSADLMAQFPNVTVTEIRNLIKMG